MHVKTYSAAAAALAAALAIVAPGAAVAKNGHDVIRADLIPSQATFPPINGVLPGNAPWIIDRGEVRVRENGRMDVRIEALVIPNADGTAANPVTSINAVLYCGGSPVADSGPQALSVPDGDARFRVTGLSVPSTCDMPTVLISPTAAVGARYIAFTAVG
jgi:hypothetical protein